jgi:hypothetical protein
MEPNADRLIEVNGLVIEKHSALYNQFCRAINAKIIRSSYDSNGIV